MTFDEPIYGSSVFTALADAARRRVLAVLDEHDHPVAVPDLARFVSARETGRDPAAVPDREYRRTLRRLRHVHLPKLDDAGLVAYDGEAVEPAYDHVATRAVEWARTAPADPAVDEGAEALADGRRREVLRVLGQVGGPLPLADLAERVATASGPSTSTERLTVALDHVHLPKLDDAGIVSYDRDRGRVTYEGLPRPCERLLADIAGDGTGRPSSGVDALLVFPID